VLFSAVVKGRREGKVFGSSLLPWAVTAATREESRKEGDCAPLLLRSDSRLQQRKKRGGGGGGEEGDAAVG